MNFKSQGLFISILILICMILICHISNYLYKKNHQNNHQKNNIIQNNKNSNSFANMTLDIPKTIPTQYNKIYYDYNDKNKIEECKLKNEAEIPCNIISSCSTPTATQYQLSDSEMAVIYRDAYASAGRELLLRTLNEDQPTPTTFF